jgi:hypothetical protein
MDRSTEQPGVIDEALRGCVRIRLHEIVTFDGQKTYGIEVTAWNAWVAQPKLLSFVGGLSRKDARHTFRGLSRHIQDFDWMEGEFVLR